MEQLVFKNVDILGITKLGAEKLFVLLVYIGVKKMFHVEQC